MLEPRLRRQVGDDELALRRIGKPGHACKGYAGVLLQDLFHFGRRDVDARALDHLRAAPREAQRAVLLQRAEIAGPEIAVRCERPTR